LEEGFVPLRHKSSLVVNYSDAPVLRLNWFKKILRARRIIWFVYCRGIFLFFSYRVGETSVIFPLSSEWFWLIIDTENNKNE